MKLSVNRAQIHNSPVRCQYLTETRPQRINALLLDGFTIHDLKDNVMKHRFILFRRSAVFYCEDTTTGKQTSLLTRDETVARHAYHDESDIEALLGEGKINILSREKRIEINCTLSNDGNFAHNAYERNLVEIFSHGIQSRVNVLRRSR